MENRKRVSFANYGKSFQEKLARIVFEDRDFSEQVREILDVNYFELKYNK